MSGSDQIRVITRLRDGHRFAVIYTRPNGDVLVRSLEACCETTGLIEAATLALRFRITHDVVHHADRTPTPSADRPRRGQQPPSEFRVAPFHPAVGQLLSDSNLALVLASWGGGAR